MYKVTLKQEREGVYGEIPERVSFVGKDIFEVTALIERLAQMSGAETEFTIVKFDESVINDHECGLPFVTVQ